MYYMIFFRVFGLVVLAGLMHMTGFSFGDNQSAILYLGMATTVCSFGIAFFQEDASAELRWFFTGSFGFMLMLISMQLSLPLVLVFAGASALIIGAGLGRRIVNERHGYSHASAPESAYGALLLLGGCGLVLASSPELRQSDVSYWLLIGSGIVFLIPFFLAGRLERRDRPLRPGKCRPVSMSGNPKRPAQAGK